MERIFNSRRIILFLLFMSFVSLKTYAGNVYNWNGQKWVGDWNCSTRYEDGWSDWSLTVPSNVTMYVKSAVYIPVSSWNNEGCSTSTKTVITVVENSGTVRKEEGSYNEYKSSWSNPYTACDGAFSGRYSSYQSGCGTCELNYSDPTAYCVKSGVGYCGSELSSAKCGTLLGYTQQCYWIHCQQNKTFYNSGCNDDYNRNNSNSGCGSRRQYCYYSSSSFKSESDKNNWKKSLSEAGGYAKKVYIYSYPTRVYINYDGSGANSICGNGNTASWKSGTNTYNSNKSIAYSLGNPVCNTSFTTGSMSLASNSNSTTYINSTGGNLKENEYYKIGYDFIGWSTTPNGNVTFQDKQSVSASSFNVKPGATVTLYAVWQIHNYQVTYSYLCGSISNITYQYGTGATLQDLNTSSCESGSNTKFLGWYENIGYTSKLEKIPSYYYKDITLYARERQVRYFDYSKGKWVYTSK